MVVRVQRLYATLEETIGALYIDDKFYCFTLEDEFRTKKVWGETRIPSGDYECELRTVGSHHERYKKKFSFHEGMIHLLHVENFKYILYHIGNSDDDSSGCVLCGEFPMPYQGTDGKRWKLVNSTAAYKETYPIIAKALLNKDKVIWQIRD